MARPRKRVRKEDITMSAEEHKAVVRREVEELYNHTGNLDAVEEIFDPKYVSHEPTSGETRGIEGARQFAATFREAFPDLQCTIEDMVAEGDKVVMRFRGSGTHRGETEVFGPPTEKRMEMTGITIKRLSDGKIVEAWTNFDAMGMMQQLGLVPEPQQAES
jgi:predicted ester cyclase